MHVFFFPSLSFKIWSRLIDILSLCHIAPPPPLSFSFPEHPHVERAVKLKSESFQGSWRQPPPLHWWIMNTDICSTVTYARIAVSVICHLGLSTETWWLWEMLNNQTANFFLEKNNSWQTHTLAHLWVWCKDVEAGGQCKMVRGSKKKSLSIHHCWQRWGEGCSEPTLKKAGRRVLPRTSLCHALADYSPGSTPNSPGANWLYSIVVPPLPQWTLTLS